MFWCLLIFTLLWEVTEPLCTDTYSHVLLYSVVSLTQKLQEPWVRATMWHMENYRDEVIESTKGEKILYMVIPYWMWKVNLMQQGKTKEKMVKSGGKQLQFLNWLISHLHGAFSCFFISLSTCSFCFPCSKWNTVTAIVVFHPTLIKYNLTIFYKSNRWRWFSLYEEYDCDAVGIIEKELLQFL